MNIRKKKVRKTIIQRSTAIHTSKQSVNSHKSDITMFVIYFSSCIYVAGATVQGEQVGGLVNIMLATGISPVIDWNNCRESFHLPRDQLYPKKLGALKIRGYDARVLTLCITVR